MIKTVDAATYVRAKTIRDLANKIDGISGYVYTGEWIDGQVGTTGVQKIDSSSPVLETTLTSDSSRYSGRATRNEDFYVTRDFHFAFDYPVDPRTVQPKITVEGTHYKVDGGPSFSLSAYSNRYVGNASSQFSDLPAAAFNPEGPPLSYDWSDATTDSITYEGINYQQSMAAIYSFTVTVPGPYSVPEIHAGRMTGLAPNRSELTLTVAKDMLSAELHMKFIVDQRRYWMDQELHFPGYYRDKYSAERWVATQFTASIGGLGFQDSREEYSRGNSTHVFKEPDSAFLRKDSKANGTLLTDMKLQELLDEGFGDGALVVEFDYKVLDAFLNIGDIVFVKDRTGRYIGGTLADGSPRIMFRVVKVEDVSKATFSQTVTAIQTAHI